MSKIKAKSIYHEWFLCIKNWLCYIPKIINFIDSYFSLLIEYILIKKLCEKNNGFWLSCSLQIALLQITGRLQSDYS